MKPPVTDSLRQMAYTWFVPLMAKSSGTFPLTTTIGEHNEIPDECQFAERFLQALDSGFPDCAGVALGIDRLLMIIMNTRNISDVIAFPVDVA